ncbi:hypothetical protein LTR16_001816 [Cryomyces antarcticus]|uniref:Amidase domain-containing protein n=1 Tax=Cryomyces antarcticus TaxID=329879 RepID=A0ABR0M801_9PEZI|nr:hypothetical protein LTR39_001179 [Cryomyces antarcticus]KAK5019300.1 hypothetical protein LTR60_001169 [Cryomyces antarcticus]KAK5292663.1 hypothetical protein LTR16_001816 [Cryomyces antarcticus]
MSVTSVDPRADTPVDINTVKDICSTLGVTIKDEEQDEYRRLLAVFHESAEEMMAMPDYIPPVDLQRFPRDNVYYPEEKDNDHRAWAWRCSIQDKSDKSKLGLLAGKTVALKDVISVKDVPMLMGTEFVKGLIPSADATVTTRILEAGGHITGKAVCENLCHSGTSHSAATGPVENPFARGYSSGGSSSGSGALVALGEVDMSIGTDQGGSVRIPACNCGLVGLKPTFGLIPYTSCGSMEPTVDHLGPITHTVRDNALMLEAIAGNDNIDDRSFGAPLPAAVPKYNKTLANLSRPKDLSGTKIGIISEALAIPVMDPRVKATFLHAAEQLKVLGATVSEISIPFHLKGPMVWTGLSKTAEYVTKTSGAPGRRGHAMLELSGLIHDMKQENWDKAYVSTKNIYLNGAYAAKNFPHLLAKCTNLSRQLRDAYDAALAEYDVLITPTLPYIATSHSKTDDTPLPKIAKQVGLTSATCGFNLTGHPALTLPIGKLEIQEGALKGSGVKLPVGLQIVGKWFAEETVFRVAYAWEQSNDWKSL